MSMHLSSEEMAVKIKDLEQQVLEIQQMKKSLEASEEQLAQIVSGSPIPTFVINHYHEITHFNQALENLTGIAAKEIIGTTGQWKAFYASKRPVMADFILMESSEDHIERLYGGKYKKSNVAPGAYEAEDFFPDMGEDGKWLFFTAAPIRDKSGRVIGAIETLMDITNEKRTTQMNEAMLRISTALHKYREIDSLLDYISSEVKTLLGAEGALVIMLDQRRRELYLRGAAYDDPDTNARVKKARFSISQLAAGKVIKSGQGLIVHDTDKSDPYPARERKLGFKIKNLIEVPIRTSDKVIGVLNANNKIEGRFGPKDIELMNMIAGNVALAIENARISDELEKAYKEVSSINKAKDKVINHLSHELKTPVTTLTFAISLLEDELANLPEDTWEKEIEIVKRNMNRIVEIQEEASDIMLGKQYKSYGMIEPLFKQSCDVLATLVARESNKGNIVTNVKKCIEDIFGIGEYVKEKIEVGKFIEITLETIKPQFAHRQVELGCQIEEELFIEIPNDPLEKVIVGLLKNAIENTPDSGKIEIKATKREKTVQINVHDFGVGIPEEYQQRIFEGFFPTQEIVNYSTKKPFDFNAGGKGADLLRMKIFSERYGFKIDMVSMLCPHINIQKNINCPGNIEKCKTCKSIDDCHHNGGTLFSITFDAVS